jgi:hypothetical protein
LLLQFSEIFIREIMSGHRTFILIILIGYLAVSCVERYYPDMEADSSSRIVVDAVINDQDSIQQVRLSKTSPPFYPKILPLTGCTVTINDIQNNEFRFQELSGQPGVYEGIIDKSALQIGNKFRLHFSTSSGEEYESGYEELLPCPPVDSVYYEVKSVLTNDPDVDLDGAQFYIDFKAPEDYGRYYRWQIDETWEYHSTFKIRMYYAASENNPWVGKIYKVIIDSLFCCYKIQTVDDIFVLSTTGLVENSCRKYKLHFVDDHTQKLMFKYSLLIKQYSISENAYYYWAGLDKNNQESGGLFDRQPEMVKSNVINTGNSGEVVLGYFSVSSKRTKRIIISDIRGLYFRDVPWCKASKLTQDFLRYSTREEWPIYLVMVWDAVEDDFVLGTAPPECFDCRLLGGTTKKPDYWDEE